MHKNRATAEATSAYASRHSNLAGNFRKVIGLDISSIGIGTYLGETDEETDHAYEEAIAAAIRGGINLIDTAVNYRFQRSERNIGKVINELVASKKSSARKSPSRPRADTSPSMEECPPTRESGSRKNSCAPAS